MKLYDYLLAMRNGEELTTWDNDYDTEIYFYAEYIPLDKWDKSLMELSKLLTVVEILEDGVVIDFAEVIESRMEELKKADLFIHCNIDAIMDDMNAIMSGYVSEEWMEKFVETLK